MVPLLESGGSKRPPIFLSKINRLLADHIFWVWYFLDMNENSTVVVTEIVIGSGLQASKGALCLVQYTGFLEDGTKFDSSFDHGRPFEFVLGSKKVIVGWSQGLLGMREGGKRKIFVPSHLGYGERQVGALIKPHSNLIFEVEMLEVRPRE